MAPALYRIKYNNIKDLLEVIHRQSPEGSDRSRGFPVKHKIRKYFFADAFVTLKNAKRRKRFESPILKKLTMLQGLACEPSAGSGSLKIRYQGLAVSTRIFVVSPHQKGRHRSLKTIPNR